MHETIPSLLLAAAERDPTGTWLHMDAGNLTFAEAAAHVASLSARLADAGVEKHDRVVLTARTNAAYLLAWLALTSLGAVAVPTDPRSTPAELGGLIAQTRPRAVLTDWNTI